MQLQCLSFFVFFVHLLLGWRFLIDLPPLLCVVYRGGNGRGTLNLDDKDSRQQWRCHVVVRGWECATGEESGESGFWARFVNVSPCTGVKIWRERLRTAILYRRNVRRAHFLFHALSTATSVEL